MSKFEKSELLTYDDLEVLLSSTEPTERAKVVLPTIQKMYFKFDNITYKFNKEIIAYNEVKSLNDSNLKAIISELITQSKYNLDAKQKATFEKIYKKEYPKLSELTTISKYSECVMVELEKDTYKFADPQFNKIHFRNGYFDLTTGEFRNRVINVDYINFYINRDYHKPSQESINKIYKIIDQIYTDKNDRDYLLQAFGIAMTGTSTQEQKVLFFIGKASAGKSTILSMLKLAFDKYVFELEASTFTKTISKSEINKILNTYLYNRNIRISNVNEPEDTRMDESLFKDFVDGNIKTTTLYEDGQNSFKHYSKICMTANTMPKIKMDQGVIRRIEAYNHKTSKFVDTDEEVNEQQHMYKKDLNLLKKLEENDELLNAISYIIVSHAVKYNKGEIIKSTPAFQDFKDEIIKSNDVVQDFIDKYIVKTNCESDKVGKNEMYNKFKEFQPKSNITAEQLRDDLKNKDFEYDFKKKLHNLHGVFLKCRINYSDVNEELEQDLIDNDKNKEIIEKQAKEIEKQAKEIEKQAKEIEELKKMVMKFNVELVKENTVNIKQTEDETTDDDFNEFLTTFNKKNE
jgi:hypothetical protein